ncbi:PilT domain-containing protein [Caballeronia arvi]|uniref:Ribonuclease VapC n=1 Tax=Caballeronia arvi TaxID=1777135 RepID=A0A158IJY2_9BURK|nr:type II toxin-antitoxin system VapC family toxin [Caballeronia arvi]SAL56693.1 PilT domain-containing protein [Caballeronia arvi]
MYLADTDVLSETRREERANEGVRAFFRQARIDGRVVHLSVVTVAELRQGVERVRRRGDARQAAGLEKLVDNVLREYDKKILPAGKEIGGLWGNLRAPHPEPALDKLIAATAIFHGLTVVTRNVRDFKETGVEMLNPFE